MWQYKYEYLGGIFSLYSKYVISNDFYYRRFFYGTLLYKGNEVKSEELHNEIWQYVV